MSKTLTIGIPTYNRSSELIACLQSVREAMACLSDHEREQVAVIVSDNASSDDTQAVINAHRANFPWLRYHRHAENVGGDTNFYRLVEMSDSKYVWILGDDDRMLPNALSKTLSQLLADYDLVICNYSTHTHGFTARTAARRFRVSQDRKIDKPEEVMQIFGSDLGYISFQVFQKSRFLNISLSEYLRFAAYGHSFMYGIYASLLPHSRALFIAEPLIAYQGDSPNSFDWYDFFALGTALVFEALESKGYSRRSVLAGKHRTLLTSIFPHTLVYKRDRRIIRQGLFRFLLPHYSRNWLFWIGLPGLLLPGPFIRFIDALILRPQRRQKSLA